jgi:hypothetical protein
MTARVFLVGEHNPYQDGQDEATRKKFALYPAPDRSSGARLCRVLGLGRAEYLRRFERRNLLAALPWSAPLAREAAHRVLGELEDSDSIILLGAKVAAAFDVPFAVGPAELPTRYIHFVRGGVVYAWSCIVLPHPSGLSRSWNDPTMPERVRSAVGALCGATSK